MLSLERPPSPALRPYVQLLWCLELDDAAAFGAPERIAPDGIVELVLHYREPMRMRHAGEAFARQPSSSLVSQTRRFVEIRPGGATGLVSVRFRPWGACHFLPMPLRELADRVIDARDVWGRAAVAELEERLCEAPDAERRFALVEAFLTRRLERHARGDVEPLVRAIWQRHGRVRIAPLARELGLTERHIERTFASVLGMTPKGYARLSRFLRSCTRLRAGGWESLSDLALDCGYYDQPHFTGDFRAFSGLTPTEFLAAERFSFLQIE